eukprot:TRINITY_DN2448_c1_g1_i1.p1 TRINITY_DN2448_c1_g1~~TRINITY_DN2448_c1_g1_i1.p1  ORF type:complete len:229 (+),score=17.90 TRINITY_DN2448_c1_g1_i1:54-740(+)
MWTEFSTLVGFTSFGIFMNAVFEKTFSSEMMAGSPRWAWLLSLSYAMMLYIPYMILMVKSKPEDTPWSRVLMCSVDDDVDLCGDMLPEKTFCLIMLSYFVRDTAVLMRSPQDNVMFLVHHLACSIGMLLMLGLPPNSGGFSYIFGTGILELGSACMCVGQLWPALSTVFYVGMTLSNTICSWMMINLVLTIPLTPMLILLLSISTILIFLRQKECIFEARKQPSKKTV